MPRETHKQRHTDVVIAVGKRELAPPLHAPIVALPFVRTFCVEHCAQGVRKRDSAAGEFLPTFTGQKDMRRAQHNDRGCI